MKANILNLEEKFQLEDKEILYLLKGIIHPKENLKNEGMKSRKYLGRFSHRNKKMNLPKENRG